MKSISRFCMSMAFFSLFLLINILPGTALGKSTVVTPSSAWCNTINASSPGDEIIFAPGSYTNPCWITARGTDRFPILIRSQNEESSQRATFAYSGSTSNVLEFRDAAHVILRGFSFNPTQAGVDAIRIWRANDIIIEKNILQGIAGVSISANANNVQRITIRQNTFKDLKYTGLYFGCHDGATCHATDLVIEGNLINSVTTPFDPSAIGYGLEIKLNSFGTVRDNTIYRTKGPGIMVYGSNRNDPASILEGNYVEGSLTEGGIVVGGGPAIVRNNVLIANAYGGVSAQNYGGRNLQKNVWIVHNTLLNNTDSGINTQGWYGGSGNVIAYNAILPKSGTSSLRPSSPSGTILGNITCKGSSFVNSTVSPYDLWPALGSVLLDSAGAGQESWRPANDFMGVSRGRAADVGAFEKASSSNNHIVGGGNPRPSRISMDLTSALPPTILRIQYEIQ